MPTKISRRLVIDASVARSSGGEAATYPTSKHCRDFLKATLKICHRVVMTPEIMEEWRAHQSGFARRWRVSMEARKKVERIDTATNVDLRSKIERAAGDEQRCAAMLKDSHLIEAALATDRTVISLDETARELFTLMAQSVGEIKNIVWVNPDKVDEQPINWLGEGARPEKNRRLDFGM